jgi:hypothetical protein
MYLEIGVRIRGGRCICLIGYCLYGLRYALQIFESRPVPVSAHYFKKRREGESSVQNISVDVVQLLFSKLFENHTHSPHPSSQSPTAPKCLPLSTPAANLRMPMAVLKPDPVAVGADPVSAVPDP